MVVKAYNAGKTTKEKTRFVIKVLDSLKHILRGMEKLAPF